MTKWEYQIIRTTKQGIMSVGKLVVTDHALLNGKTIDDAFEILGQEGWELATACLPAGYAQHYSWYTFKRPRPE